MHEHLYTGTGWEILAKYFFIGKCHFGNFLLKPQSFSWRCILVDKAFMEKILDQMKTRKMAEAVTIT